MERTVDISKIIKAIKSARTGAVSYQVKPFSFIELMARNPSGCYTEYSVSVNIGSSVFIADGMDQDKALLEVEAAVKQYIIEGLYVEFRSTLSKLKLATYQGDNENTRNLVSLLYEQMYTDI